MRDNRREIAINTSEIQKIISTQEPERNGGILQSHTDHQV